MCKAPVRKQAPLRHMPLPHPRGRRRGAERQPRATTRRLPPRLKVTYSDGVPGDLTTAHPNVLSDGSLLNFTRTLPFGGFHLYK